MEDNFMEDNFMEDKFYPRRRRIRRLLLLTLITNLPNVVIFGLIKRSKIDRREKRRGE